MSSVLDPSALAESPLADLHLLANELGVDGFRRLRKADLIDAIVAKQAGEDYTAPEAAPVVAAVIGVLDALGSDVVLAGLLGDDRVDQVGLAEAAVAVHAELVGEQVEIGKGRLREGGGVEHGRHEVSFSSVWVGRRPAAL